MKSISSGMDNGNNTGSSLAHIIKVQHLLDGQRFEVVEDGSGGFGEVRRHFTNSPLLGCVQALV